MVVDPAGLETGIASLAVSLTLAALAAVIVGVSTFAVIRLQKAAELETKEEFDKYKLEAAKSLSETDARTKEAEFKLAEIREKVGRPRQLNETVFSARLHDIRKIPVVVSHDPNDPDSFWLSFSIVGALERAQWDVKIFGETPQNIKACAGHVGGVIVLSKTISTEEIESLSRPPAERAKTPFLTLADALITAIGENSAGFATCPFLSADMLHVVVSPRWVILPK